MFEVKINHWTFGCSEGQVDGPVGLPWTTVAVMKLDLRAAHSSKGVDDARTTNQAESEQDQVQDVQPKKLNDEILVLLDVSQMITSFASSVQFQEKSHGFPIRDSRTSLPGVQKSPNRYRRIHRKSELRDREAKRVVMCKLGNATTRFFCVVGNAFFFLGRPSTV